MIWLLIWWCPKTRKITTVRRKLVVFRDFVVDVVVSRNPKNDDSSGGAIFRVRGAAGKCLVSNTNSFTDPPISAPGPGGAFLEVPGRWSEGGLWQRCECADLHEILCLPREKATPHSGLVRRDEDQKSEKSRQYNENGRF